MQRGKRQWPRVICIGEGDGTPLQGALEGAQLYQERGLESSALEWNLGLWITQEATRCVLGRARDLLGLFNGKQ